MATAQQRWYAKHKDEEGFAERNRSHRKKYYDANVDKERTAARVRYYKRCIERLSKDTALSAEDREAKIHLYEQRMSDL